ncbi:unnamed protein product [Closterium sp. NIES-64]|nr:unnamed protein product [Closterium sp. NIES-64]
MYRWQFYHPTSRRVLSSQDVTFDESVPYYRLFPYRTPSLPPPPLFLVPDAVEPVEVTGDSGATEGAEPGGADSLGADCGGAEPRGATLGGAEPGGAEPGGAEPGGAEPGGAEPVGAAPASAVSGGPSGASSRREPLSPQELREWFARRRRRATGAGGSSTAEGTGAEGPEGARTGSTGAAGPAGTSGAGVSEGVVAEATAVGAEGAAGAAGGTRAGCATGAGAAAGSTGSVPAVTGVAARPRPYFVPLLHQILGLPPSTGPPPPLECPLPDKSQLQLRPTSPLPAPSPYTGPTGGLAERRKPASRPALPSSLPALADPESDSLRTASPTVTRLLATVVTDPSFESTAASALVAELVDFAARCRLDYAASLVAESESVCPPSVGGECALGTDVLEDR